MYKGFERCCPRRTVYFNIIVKVVTDSSASVKLLTIIYYHVKY